MSLCMCMYVFVYNTNDTMVILNITYILYKFNLNYK